MQVNLGNVGGSSATMINVDHLPVEHEDKGTKVLGVFLTLFSLVWGGVPTAALIGLTASGKFEPALLIMLVFTVVGIGLFILGIKLLLSRKIIRIDVEGVTVRQKGLFGWTSWTEPFDRYRGVLSRSEYHSGGKNSPSYTLYIVELAHDEKQKIVRLYTSRSEAGHRKIWEEYCRKLKMSAVEKDGDGYIERSVEDLDKSAAELVREGKVDLAFDPRKNVPEHLQVVPEDDELVITVVRKKISLIGALLGLAIPSVFIYVGFFVKGAPFMFGIVGVFFLLVITAVMIWNAVTKEQIRVSVRGVNVCQLTPWGQTAGRQIKSNAIETVRVWKKDGTGAEAVWLAGDTATISVGQGLKREALEWLRDCILKVLAS